VIAVSPVSSAGPGAHDVSAQPPGSEGGSLLPSPNVTALVGRDPLSMLYLLEQQDQSLSLDEGTKRIGALQAERNRALDQELQAIAQEAEAAEHKSFWDDLGSILGEVAKVAGIIASAAAVVCSGGAAAPLAVALVGAALSGASFAEGESHFLEKMGVDGQVAGWIDLGLSVAGAACSFGASVAASAGQVGNQMIGTVDRAATVVSGTATVARGGTVIAAGQAQSDGERASADEAMALAQASHLLRFMSSVIDDARASDDDSKRIMNTIANAKGIQDKTAVISATALRG
jgi:hypothetical protein